MKPDTVDILIVGGGPVGAALALALEGSGHETLLAEARGEPDRGSATARSAASGDARALALSHASRQILERLGAWSALAATAIQTIHISQRGAFGRTLIRATDCALPALGYVVNYDDLLHSLLAAPCSARRWFGAKLIDFDGNTAVIQAGKQTLTYTPRLTVFADGAHIARAKAEAPYTKDYRQNAVVAWVKSEQAHCGRAWERFTPEGPLALLPHGSGYALVWTVDPERSAALCALETPAFLAQLQQAFGQRLGAFIEAGARVAFPLALRFRREEVIARSLAIGNAAQTLHPVAGQGFNLGLRDAWELALLARDAPDPGDPAFIRAYRRTRALDRRAGIGFTDGLVDLFSNSDPMLALARGAGLLALDLLPVARRFVARRMIFGARALP